MDLLKKIVLTLTIFFINLPTSCSQTLTEVVTNYAAALNQGNKSTLDKLVHKDFKKYFEDQLIMKNKDENLSTIEYSAELNFHTLIISIKESENKVFTTQKITNDTIKILGISPIHSKLIYEFKDGQIVKITESSIEKFTNEVNDPLYSYAGFSEWLNTTHNMTAQDFELTAEGAKRKRNMLLEFAEYRKKVQQK